MTDKRVSSTGEWEVDSEFAHRLLVAIGEAAPDAIILYDNAGVILSWNPAAERLFGYSKIDIVGQSIQTVVPSRYMSARGSDFDRLLRAAERRLGGRTVEVLGLQRGGEEIPLEVSLARVSTPHGPMYTAIARDISERKADHARLLRHEQALATIQVGVAVTDEDGRIQLVNRRLEEMFGYSEKELVGQPLETLMPARFRARHVQKRQEFIQTRGRLSLGTSRVLIAVDKNGREFPAEIGGKVTQGEDGVIYAMSMFDVSERVAGQRQNKLLETALEQAANGVMITDKDGLIQWINPAFTTLTGYARVEALGLDSRVLISSQNPSELIRSLERSLDENTEWSGEIRCRRSNGSVYTDNLSLTPMLDKDGTATHFIALMEDATERVLLRESLAEAREDALRTANGKSAFLSMMSHEIRTPMGGILGLSELILDTDLSAEQRQLSTQIHGAAQGLLQILNDVLDYSRIEAQRMEIELSPFDPRQVVEATLELLDPEARRKGLTLLLKTAESVPPSVVGDSNRVKQVLVNLVGNAVKFTNTGSVEVSVDWEQREGQNELSFAVHDTGIGIPEDRLQEIFKDFTQADSTTARKYGGTGLGLAICERLVTLMGGALTVDSELGKGSVLRVTLPLAVPQTGSVPISAAPMVEDRARRALHILVAEDNPVNQQVVRAMLAKRGHTLDIAGNGVEAVARASETRYDVILMDIQMPEMDGVEATRRIRLLPGCEDLCIIAFSAHVLEAERQEFLDAGMSDHLAKPFTRAQLLETVESAAGDHPEPSTAGVPAIDIDGFRELLGDDADSILELFRIDAARRMAEIEAAVNSGDADEIRRAAHAFRSAAGAVRADGLAQSLGELESDASKGCTARAGELSSAARLDLSRVLTELALGTPTNGAAALSSA